MKDARRVLHVRCGDDIRDKLVEAGIPGDYLSFADPAWLGPPPAFNAWLAGRAALIEQKADWNAFAAAVAKILADAKPASLPAKAVGGLT